MIVTAHLISNSFILNSMVSLCLVEKRDRTTKQNTRRICLYFVKDCFCNKFLRNVHLQEALILLAGQIYCLLILRVLAVSLVSW